MVKTVVSRGTIRAVLDENKAMLELYRPADQNRIQREALRRALQNHRGKHIAKRFSQWVKAPPMSYQWKKRGRPLFRTGTMAKAVYQGSIRVSTRKGLLQGSVKFPAGHPLPTGSGQGWPKNAKPSNYRNEIQRVMASMTDAEMQEMLKRMGDAMLGINRKAKIAKRRPKGGGERRRSLTANQRQRFKASLQK